MDKEYKQAIHNGKNIKGHYVCKKYSTLLPWPGGSVGWSIILYTKRLGVQFPVRAHI